MPTGRRAGVSELLGTLMMVAITLIAAAAVIGWIGGQAATSETALGANAADQANYFKENFVFVGTEFSYGSNPCATFPGQGTFCNRASVDVYNNGAISLTLKYISIVNSTSKSVSGTPVPLLSVSENLTSSSTNTYTVKYDCGGTTGVTSSASVVTGTQPVSVQSVPPTVYTVTLPSACSITSGILDGASYTITALGLYGNTVTAQVTANG